MPNPVRMEILCAKVLILHRLDGVFSEIPNSQIGGLTDRNEVEKANRTGT